MVDINDIENSEKEIFNEIEEIQKEFMKLNNNDYFSNESEEDGKEKYSEEDEYKIYSMIQQFNYGEIPDIRDELKLLDDLRKSNTLDSEEKEYLREEYLKNIQVLVDAIEHRKTTASKMLEFFNKLRF